MNKRQYLVLSSLMLCLIILGAFIKIPTPYVPLTLQVMFVNLIALILPRRYSLLTTGSYLILGIMGLPIFAKGGGVSYILNPTFGYIIGFVIASFLSSLFLDSFGRNSIKNYTIATVINLFIIYILGLSYIYLILNIYMGNTMGIVKIISIGFTPFILGDMLTCSVSVVVADKLRPMLKNSTNLKK